MNIVSSYVHALEGRLRIKIPEVKGTPLRAREVENHLQLLTGMNEVSANPITGNVLILYDPRLLREDQIISTLKELGYLVEALPKAQETKGRGAVELVTSTIASTLMEVALSRLVAALI
jgi:copper chaperone CopZ